MAGPISMPGSDGPRGSPAVPPFPAACALEASCGVRAGRILPNLSRTLALCEALLGGEGSLWLEGRVGPSWSVCAPLRRVRPEVIAALRREGVFDARGWLPVPLAGEDTLFAAAPLCPSSGGSLGLLVLRLRPEAAAAHEPDVLGAMAALLADQLAAEEEGCGVRQARHLADEEAATCRSLLRDAEHRVADDLEMVGALLKVEAGRRMPALSGIHAALDRGEDAGALRVGDYLHGLAERLRPEGDPQSGRLLVCVSAGLRLPASRLVRLGLVVAEMLGDAVRRDGEVTLEVRALVAGIEVAVKRLAGPDDGEATVQAAFPVLDLLGIRRLAGTVRPDRDGKKLLELVAIV